MKTIHARICFDRLHDSVTFLVLMLVLTMGCAVPLRYDLKPGEVTQGRQILPQRVAVAELTDNRPAEERLEVARRATGASYPDDYTFDSGWKLEEEETVTGAVTQMMVDHLVYSRTFTDVARAPFSSSSLDCTRLKGLAAQGFDLALCGRLEHFYGFAKDNDATMISLSIATLGLGGLAYAAVPRPVVARTQMSGLKLLSTATCETLWSGDIESSFASMKALSTDDEGRFARQSLRNAMNLLVEDLSARDAGRGDASLDGTDPRQASQCPAETQGSEDLQRSLEEVRRIWRAGHQSKAIRLLEEITRREPQFVQGQVLLQECWALRFGTGSRMPGLRSVQGLDPTDPLSAILRGRALCLSGDHALSVAEFDRLDQRLPNCPLLLAFRAEALRKREMVTEALRDARRAVEIDPESARAREELGLVLLAQNPPDTAGAEQQAAELLRKDPIMPGASAIQAHVQYMRGNRREAFRMIKKIHAQAPYDLTVREVYDKTFLFDLRPPIEILDHPTGYCLGSREWSVGAFLMGHIKRGFPGGLAIGTNTLGWIGKEPNASLKLRLLREGVVKPAAALDARYNGNMKIEDSDAHASEFPVSLSLSKRLLPRISFHLGGTRVLQDRKSPFPVKDGKAVLFRELESYAALDLELLHNLKLLVEPSAVRFGHDDKWEWQGVAGVLLSGSGSLGGMANRIKAGTGFRSWDNSWFVILGLWWGR